ncbi:hypothetical protein [Kitasatospora mediocidica]|uniref:hypothetical protein n=1 Tax=Kitasatospora mediocidica TaxID=58352 RepID=UPI00056C3CB0|nr:hypothetical protein [Kitasatospora mediocidica]
MTSIWGYNPESQYTPGMNLTGYKVEASDGHIGKVDDATDDVGSAYIVVNCKPWLIGKHVMLPAGTVSRVDHDDQSIQVNRTKDQIKGAPEYDPDVHKSDPTYREGLATYYGPQGR